MFIKKIRKAIVFFISVLVFSLVVIFFGESILSTDSTVSVWVFWFLGIVILSLALLMPVLIKDKTFCGTIVKAIVKTEDTKSLTVGLGVLQQKHVIDLVITSFDGKTHYKNISEIEDKAEARAGLDRYKEGDIVFHLCATPYTIVLPRENDLSVQCAVCGRVNDKSNHSCDKCKHTLIKSSSHFQ